MDAPLATLPHAGKQRRWRRLFQFSLRTLLLLTTVAAALSWWLAQPKIHGENLAGGALKLRRQVRPLEPNESLVSDWEPRRELVSIGPWRLFDRSDNPLAVGHYENGVPHGNWTVYHATGHKAVVGRMHHGRQVGVWTTWDEQGQLTSQTNHGLPSTNVNTPLRAAN